MSERLVWVTYSPTPDCMCWMDAVCPDGWTWQEDECPHRDGIFEDVHESLADAVRNLFQQCGGEAIGTLLRERFAKGSAYERLTKTVYVMPPSDTLWRCDHDASVGDLPSPVNIIERKWSQVRSRPGDPFRVFQNGYRGR